LDQLYRENPRALWKLKLQLRIDLRLLLAALMLSAAFQARLNRIFLPMKEFHPKFLMLHC